MAGTGQRVRFQVRRAVEFLLKGFKDAPRGRRKDDLASSPAIADRLNARGVPSPAVTAEEFAVRRVARGMVRDPCNSNLFFIFGRLRKSRRRAIDLCSKQALAIEASGSRNSSRLSEGRSAMRAQATASLKIENEKVRVTE